MPARNSQASGLRTILKSSLRGPDILLGTGDAPISYTGTDSGYWAVRGEQGRNWTGRLLELVRSELQAQRAGIEVPGTPD